MTITEFPITTREASATGNELVTAATPAAARAAAELGDSATRDVGTASGTVAAGNDPRIVGAFQDENFTTEGRNFSTGAPLTLGQQATLRAAINAASEAVGVSGTTFNVSDYGAVGDGVAFDTAAINAAIQACHQAGGGSVYLPAGEYLVTKATTAELGGYWPIPDAGPSPAILLLQGVNLIGSGIDKTKIKLLLGAPSNTPLVKGVGLTDFKVSSIHFFGNRTDLIHSSEETEGLDLKGGSRRYEISFCKFEAIENEAIDLDMVIENVPSYEEGGVQNHIHDCIFEFVGGSGVHNGLWTTVERCVFTNVAKARYDGGQQGLPGSSGAGAIDGSGIALRIKDCFFFDCARLLDIYLNPVGVGSRENTRTIIENCFCDQVHAESAIRVSGDLGRFMSMFNSTFVGSNILVGNMGRMDNCNFFADGTNTELVNIRTANRMTNCRFIGMGVNITQVEAGAIMDGCIIDCSGRTTNVSPVTFGGNDANDITISNCKITQNATATEPMIGTNSTVVQSRNRYINNTLTGSCNHYIRIGDNCIASGNICTGGLANGITIRGNDNIVIGNILDRAIVPMAGSVGNVIANNIAL